MAKKRVQRAKPELVVLPVIEPSADDVVAEYDAPDEPDLPNILTDNLVSAIKTYVDIAKESLEDGPTLDTAYLDGHISKQAFEQYSDDQRLAMAELQVLLAKHGKTPANSVEGVIKLRKMLKAAYRDEKILPSKTKLQLAEIERDAKSLEITYEAYLIKVKNEATAAAIISETAALQAVQEREETETTRVEASVANSRRVGVAKNEQRVLAKSLDNDRFEKELDARLARFKIVKQKLVKPLIYPVLRAAFWGTVILAIFSFFVESSGVAMYPLLAPFNWLWHLIVDPIVGGTVNLFNLSP